MTPYAKLVSVALLCSVALNGYLFVKIHQGEEQQGVITTKAGLPTVQTTSASPTTQRASNNTGLTGPNDDPQAELAEGIRQARQWLESGDFRNIEPFIQRALRQFDNHPSLLLLEADWVLATQPLTVALSHFFALLDSNKLPADQQTALQQRVIRLQNEAIQALYEAQQWDLLAQFVEPLFQLFPTDSKLILILAESYARQQKFVLMEDVLASLADDHPEAMRLRRRMLATHQNTAVDTSTTLPDRGQYSRVTLQKSGEHYLVNIGIQGVKTQMLLDTGASITTISHALYQRLRYHSPLDVLGLFDVNTAGGLIRAPLVKVESLTLGPHHLIDVGVLVLPHHVSLNSDGLLGMNVLKQFQFQLDQDKAELLLRLKD